jgi:4-carboxymuconolactone decarboxylase
LALSPVPFERDRHARGLSTLQRIGGPDAAAPLLALTDLAPDLVRFAIDFAYGEVLSRSGIALKQRQLCTVAALGAMGTAAFQLRWHIDGALNLGWQPVDVLDAVVFTGATTASPAVARSLGTVREVFEARGIGADSLRTVDDAVACWRQGIPWEGRAGFDDRTRHLIAVSALTAVANAPARLEAEIVTALGVGATREEIVEVIEQMAIYAGFPAALNGLAAARAAFVR